MTDATSTELRATLNLQRKAAIAAGGAVDHAGRVKVIAMDGFDITKTIFGALEGLPKVFMEEKLAKEPVWNTDAQQAVEVAYEAFATSNPAPPVDQTLVDFMVQSCDFSMEHADGSFLEHLVFCHDYAARYYPEHSPNVALLHSILGTATNTFAMDAEKLPALKERLTDFEAEQVELFPSILRLFYDGYFLDELEQNIARIDQLQSLQLYRVIDNEPLTVSAESMWVNLNYHLMHFVDFMPAANWSTHRGDPLLQMFARLSSLLDRSGQRRAHVQVSFPTSGAPAVDEDRTPIGRVVGLLPASATMKLAKKSINEYSTAVGHNLSYRLDWNRNN